MLIAVFYFSGCKVNQTENLNKNKIDEEAALQNDLKKSVKYLSGKDTVEAYFTSPEGSGPFPALILIHENWGLNDFIRNKADALTMKGFVALAINLYRQRSTKNLEEAQQLQQSLSKNQAVKDIQAAYNYLQNHTKVNKKNIGIIGWGLGGGYSILAPTFLPSINSAVIIYGSPLLEISDIKKIKCPVLGIFGETDRSIPLTDVLNFEKALKTANKDSKIIIYRNVGHSFMNPELKENYNAVITDRAWREILKFLEKHFNK